MGLFPAGRCGMPLAVPEGEQRVGQELGQPSHPPSLDATAAMYGMLSRLRPMYTSPMPRRYDINTSFAYVTGKSSTRGCPDHRVYVVGLEPAR